MNDKHAVRFTFRWPDHRRNPGMTDADAAEAQMAPVFAFATKIFGREPCTNEDCLCRSHDSVSGSLPW